MPLSYVQCFLYLVSSSINVSIFHITWLDTFWTYLVWVSRYTHTDTNTTLQQSLVAYFEQYWLLLYKGTWVSWVATQEEIDEDSS